MKLTRGFFNNYRILDSGVINETYIRTRYFSSAGIRSGGTTTVFISHKHSDLENDRDMNDLKGLLNYLKKEYRIEPYIDSMDKRMPKETCAETADRIKTVIDYCDKFILLATNDALASKWCNWEVGIADEKKSSNNNMAIMPMVESQASLYKGNEYLELYPYIEQRSDEYGKKSLYISIRESKNSRKWITLRNWLNNIY